MIVALTAGLLLIAGASGLAPAALAQSTSAPVEVRRALCVPELRDFDPANIDLSGTWVGNDDGIYYIRQRGDTVFWNGMSDLGGPADLVGRSWNNVGMGTLAGTTLTVDWSDVPRSASDGSGRLVIEVEGDAAGHLRMKTVSGGEFFGGHSFHPCSESGGGLTAVLPPDGVYQAEITASDLLAAGAYPGDDTYLAGTATWTLQDGRFSIGSGQLDASDCYGSYAVHGGVVRLLFSSDCQGMDDLRFTPGEDGSTMTATFVGCGPTLGCNARTDRALFERTWTKVE